jgi:benzoate/toluate 1,2-dioxygenase alpha subunit
MEQREAVDPAALIDERPHTFRVHGAAYTDPEIFRLEMKRIFETVWVFVGHASEIPAPGRFKTSSIGRQPVIVVRADDGAINVFVNRCVHRASVVCREARGEATGFTCPYHGWSYTIDGRLTGIPMRNEAGGYSAHFDAPDGLVRVPRVETYRGLIFATFNAEAPPLLEHLGAARRLIDRKFDRSPTGEIALLSDPYVMVYPGNWKFQSENIVDGYHFLFVHAAFAKLQGIYGDTTGDFGVHKGNSAAEMRKIRSQGVTLGTAQGHGLSETPCPSPEALLTGPYAAYFRALLARHGEREFEWITGSGASSIFPTFGIIHHQLRSWRPIAPDKTEVTVYPFALAGVPAEINEGWLRSQERFYGPSGYGMVDDVEAFAMNQQGLQGDAVDWLIIERGIDIEERDAAGDMHGVQMSETSMRAFWRRWRQLMAAE